MALLVTLHALLFSPNVVIPFQKYLPVSYLSFLIVQKQWSKIFGVCFLEHIFVKIRSSSFIMLFLFSCQNFSKDLTLSILCVLMFDRRQTYFDLLFEQKFKMMYSLWVCSLFSLIFFFFFLLFLFYIMVKEIIEIHTNSLNIRQMDRNGEEHGAWEVPEGDSTL